MNQINEDNLLLDESWLVQAKQELSKPLPPSIAGQLRAARRTALSNVSRHSTRSPFLENILRWGVPALAGVAAVALAINLLVPSDVTNMRDAIVPMQTAGNMASEDLSIIKAPDDLEFYQNLEFLLWMEQTENGSSQS